MPYLIGISAFSFLVFFALIIYGHVRFKSKASKALFFFHCTVIVFLSFFQRIEMLAIPLFGIISLFIFTLLKGSGKIDYQELRRNIVAHTILYGVWPIIYFSVENVLGLLDFKAHSGKGLIIIFTPVTAFFALIVQKLLLLLAKKANSTSDADRLAIK